MENKNAINLYKKLGFIGEKYLAEKLPYDCYIYSKNLMNQPISLWNNKNLKLLQQSDFENVDEQAKETIYNNIKKNI